MSASPDSPVAEDLSQVERRLAAILSADVKEYSRKVDDQVRITAQLVEAVAGHHLWAERYDRDASDVFGVQDEVSQTIAIAVKKILPAEDGPP